MKIDLSKLTPPGYPLGTFFACYSLCGLAAAVWSLGFFTRFHRALAYAAERMPDFHEIFEGSLALFWALAVLSLTFSIFFYRYMTSGSKSIYLLRRMPTGYRAAARCLILPVMGAVLAGIIALIILMCCFAFYMLNTPDELLTPDQWDKLWRCV